MTPLTADDDRSREQQPTMYCSVCGDKLHPTPTGVPRSDGKQDVGYYCPKHPSAMITAKKPKR